MRNGCKTGSCLFLLSLLLILATGCKGGTERVSGQVAITMSASVKQTKAIISSIDDLKQNHSIGIYGFKEQNTNSANKFLVFDNQPLHYSNESGWSYSPERYWDMQTRYSFVAYAPFTVENAQNSSYNSIIINKIPQYQNANDASALDYIVALSNNPAKTYVENYDKTVNLVFHHILANFQVWAYYEGFDTEFVITGMSLGANSNGQKVPAADAVRSYTQQFDSERADGVFNSGSWATYRVTLPVGDFTVPKESANMAQVANLLVVPFIADENGVAKIPLTIYYTKNGVEQTPATVSIGISAFESDNKYRLDLKFEQKGATVVPVNIQIKNWTETEVDPSDIHNW